jgi:hypothetical protein
VIEGGVLTFIRTDHIGRPVFGTNTTGTKTWTAAYLPFGGVRTTTSTQSMPASPDNGSNPNPACTRTGCGITIRQRGGICRPTRSGWSTGRVCMGMLGRIRGGGLTRRANIASVIQTQKQVK